MGEEEILLGEKWDDMVSLQWDIKDSRIKIVNGFLFV